MRVRLLTLCSLAIKKSNSGLLGPIPKSRRVLPKELEQRSGSADFWVGGNNTILYIVARSVSCEGPRTPWYLFPHGHTDSELATHFSDGASSPSFLDITAWKASGH